MKMNLMTDNNHNNILFDSKISPKSKASCSPYRQIGLHYFLYIIEIFLIQTSMKDKNLPITTKPSVISLMVPKLRKKAGLSEQHFKNLSHCSVK